MRKKVKVILPLILFSLAMFGIFTKLSQHTPCGSSSKFKSDHELILILNCSFPKVPSEVLSLKIIERNYTREELLNIARNLFNLSGEIQIKPQTYYNSEEIGWYSIQSKKYYLELCRCGDIVYFDRYYVNHEPDPLHPPEFPSYLEAKEIANRFLSKISSFNLTPRHPQVKIEFKEVNIGGKTIVEIRGQYCSYITHLDVLYEVKFDKMSFCGYAELSVSIGDKGRIVLFEGSLREVKPGEPVKITVKPRDAFQRLATHHKLKATPNKIVINSIELAYWCPHPHEKHEKLVPVYLFRGKVFFEDGTVQDYDQAIPAVNCSISSFENSQQFYQAFSFKFHRIAVSFMVNTSIFIEYENKVTLKFSS